MTAILSFGSDGQHTPEVQLRKGKHGHLRGALVAGGLRRLLRLRLPRRRPRRRGRAGQAPKLAPAARCAVAIGASVAWRLPALARVAGASSIHRLSIRRLAGAPLSVRLLEVRAQPRIGVVGARRRGRAGQAPKLAPVARRVLTLFLFDYISPSLPSGASPHPCVPGCACRALAVHEELFRRGSWRTIRV